EQKLTRPVNYFCYPNGSFDQESLQAARQNYSAAVTDANGIVDGRTTISTVFPGFLPHETALCWLGGCIARKPNRAGPGLRRHQRSPQCSSPLLQLNTELRKTAGRNVKSVAHRSPRRFFSSGMNSRKSLIVRGFLIGHLESELPRISDRESLTFLKGRYEARSCIWASMGYGKNPFG